ncbi:MAG: T9SS type A sorting domain-containing protein [Marinilabiliaceae bacterium]|nr:T9SS type A sorting domain-containing protein [Marinilabiliaceae bacterium]
MMKRKYRYQKRTSIICLAMVMTVLIHTDTGKTNHYYAPLPPTEKSAHSPEAEQMSMHGRHDYFFNMLRDPVQNRIPAGIHADEQKKYKALLKNQLKATNLSTYTWSEVGPSDVGGRTRALAIDKRNSNIILAGGVSGGIWKSIDKGLSWSFKSKPSELQSISWICQDPRTGHQNTWYYSSGEYTGNSANAPKATYFGHGLYKSDDNGETWYAILGTETNPYVWDNWIDYVSKIEVDPNTGDLYIAANGFGLLVAVKQNDHYELSEVIGGADDHTYCDFDIDEQGNKLVVLSEYSLNKYSNNPPVEPANPPGVYYSAKGSSEYTQIDPASATFPTTHQRSLVRIAPSNPGIGYVFTTITEGQAAFHQIDLSSNTLTDRTANLPEFSETTGRLGLQGNYNMTLVVKPDDPEFIIIGNTSLFRSDDAFNTITTKDYAWIGGYSSNGGYKRYPNHHPDCHITVFDPNAPNTIWSGHDGGISMITDITQVTAPQLMPWVSLNNGYNVTQFYTVGEPVKAHDDRYLGGTQDNGTSYFQWHDPAVSTQDFSSGDGGHCFIGAEHTFAASQYGRFFRTQNDAEGNPLCAYSPGTKWSRIYPSEATGKLYVNPYVLNPNDESVIYYAGGSQLWINKNIATLPNYISYGTTEGWYAPTDLSVPNYTISAIASSKVPGHILYYAAYSSAGKPLVYRVENSLNEPDDLSRQDISVAQAPTGAYPYAIAINPFDANEILVIFSNYGVPSIFHSTNGGESYSCIDGNLAATEEIPGPSVRSATISNWSGEKNYFLSTSIGVFQTHLLNGPTTDWQIVSKDKLGNVPCNQVKSSVFDGKIVVASHGRGIFAGLSDNPLFIQSWLPNLQRLTTSPDDEIDLSTIFGHTDNQSIQISIKSNTNTQVVTSNLSGHLLSLDYADHTSGTAIITVRGQQSVHVADVAFSVTVEDDVSTGNSEEVPEQSQALLIYPNPCNGLFKVSLQDHTITSCQAKIYNGKGQLIFSRSFADYNDISNYQFKQSHLPEGVYLFILQDEQIQITQKLIISPH